MAKVLPWRIFTPCEIGLLEFHLRQLLCTNRSTFILFLVNVFPFSTGIHHTLNLWPGWIFRGNTYDYFMLLMPTEEFELFLPSILFDYISTMVVITMVVSLLYSSAIFKVIILVVVNFLDFAKSDKLQTLVVTTFGSWILLVSKLLNRNKFW